MDSVATAPDALGAWLFFYGILTIRYLAIAGLAFVIWYVWRRRRILPRKIQHRMPDAEQYWREVGYSFLTFGIFAGVGVLIAASPLRGHTRIYGDIAEYGWFYFAFSVLAIIVIHDAYFYFMHRAIHHPRIFGWVHRTHHRSTNPTPWAAFAFHPLEAVAEAAVIGLIAFLFPVHPGAIAIWLLFMTVYNVYGHLGWEVFPHGTEQHPVGRWFNTSVSHNMHHERFESNYGLYFTWWDRLFGTLHREYDEAFDRITAVAS